MTGLLIAHLAAVLAAGLTLWSMRHEWRELAITVTDHILPPIFAILAAALLLIVSPGRKIELWAVCIVVGLAGGLAMGMTLQGAKDFGQNLVRVYRSWDGVGAAGLLLVLSLIRLVTSDLTGRTSSGHGVLAALAAALAAYLVGRVMTFQLYTAPRTIHLDMYRGQRRARTDI